MPERFRTTSQPVHVVCIGPAVTVRGGISRVIEKIQNRFPSHIRFTVVPTFTAYVGADETTRSDRGSKLVQAAVYLVALSRILFQAFFRRAVFHVHFSSRGSLIRKGLVCVLLRLFHCRYVVHAHAAETNLFHAWLPQPVRRLLLWGFAGARWIIALTRLWHSHYASMFNVPLDRVLLLPNPADQVAAVPDRSRRSGLNLLFLGRIGERKGAFDIIRAFATLPGPLRQQCQLTLAGDGEADAARELVRHCGCQDGIAVLGWVRGEEVNRLLENADVLLLPSRAEGMAMSLLEGLSWGLAIVTTAVGGAGEFLEDHRNCLLVTPGDIPGIRDAIRELAGSTELRGRLALGAKRTASRFSLESYVTKLTCLYEELANESPAGARIQAAFRPTASIVPETVAPYLPIMN